MYSYLVEIKISKKSHFIIAYLPIWVLLILTLGLQYDVGTDYMSYLSIASGIKSADRMEPLFGFLINIVKRINQPQFIFVFTGLIQVAFFMLIIYEIRKLGFKMYHFFFLYFTLSLTFFNQLNGIRQYIAVYIAVFAILKLIDNKGLFFIALIFISSLFHSSAIFLLPIFFLKPILKKRFSANTIIIFMFLLVLINSFDLSKLVKLLLSYTPYKRYIHSSYFGRMPLQGIITKIPKLAIVLFSAYLIDKKGINISDKENKLLNLGYLGLFVQIMSFSSTLIWRFYQYVDLLIIFPVLILFKSNQQRDLKLLIALVLFVMLIIKILIIPRGEYLYRSILL